MVFFFLSLLVSPIIMFIAAMVLEPVKERIEEKALANGEMKKCPSCAELVKVEAKICKHCNSEFS